MTLIFDKKPNDYELVGNLKLSEVNTGKAKLVKIHPLLLVAFRMLRDRTGGPIYINSGYRDPVYNKKVGGGSKSQHIEGTAIDISVKTLGSVGELANYCENAIEMIRKQGNILVPGYLGNYLAKFIDYDIYGGIGIYNTFVHVDVRREKARWNG